MDGGETTVAPDVPGSVSRNSPFGVHLGQKLDSRVQFTGAIDDVRVYDRALTDAELSGVRADERPGERPTGPGLPLDRVRGAAKN